MLSIPNTNPFRTIRDIEDLVKAFYLRTLAPEHWTHDAHLIVGIWYVSKYGEDASIYLLKKRIIDYNESVGVPNTEQSGYHETITVFWIRIVGQYIRYRDGDLEEKINSFLRSPLADKNLLLRFYSRERIFSLEARKKWIAPDLKFLSSNFALFQSSKALS